MKKRSKITELLDSLLAGDEASGAKPEKEETVPGTAEPAPDEEKEELARLGEAFLARLKLPEGMSIAEAVDSIIDMWEKADREKQETEPVKAHAEKTASEKPENGENENRRLPRILRGGIGSMPEADYESMSAEQFRRLKKQLSRAALDGRKIRL